MYYYGARYYDATIGRFISPDTLVQDPGIPQSLNRYSYCLNNPLKYADPSGHVVDILGYDIQHMYNMDQNARNELLFWAPMDFRILWQAYDALKSIDPSILNTMEKSPTQFNITFDSKSPGGAATSPHADNPQVVDVTINNSKQEDMNELIDKIAHESVHCFGRTLDPDYNIFDSQFEEMQAYRYQFWVSTQLGYHEPGLAMKSMITDDFNTLFANSGYTTANHYTPYPTYHQAVNNPLAITPTQYQQEIFNMVNPHYESVTRHWWDSIWWRLDTWMSGW